MIERTLSQIARMLGASVKNRPSDDDPMIRGVSTDSRDIAPGNLYIPLKGARADGHDFIAQVKQAHAAAALWDISRIPYPNFIPLILVKDTLQAMQDLARAYLAEIHPLTVGITGSNGKTSTKDMAAAILSEKFRTIKTQGNHNNEIGLPLTVFDISEDTQAAVLEMGMENYGEIDFLCSIAPLDIAAIVSIGSAHMENFGSQTNIARAKCEILDGLHGHGTFIYDGASPELRTVLNEKEIPESVHQISFDANPDADTAIHLTGNIVYRNNGIEFPVNVFDRNVFVPAAGRHQASNALCAIAIGLAAGLDEDQILDGLAKTRLTKMRSRLYPLGKGTILDDSYKSNPESAKAGIDTLMEIPAEKHIAVMAGMLDLGPSEKELHEETGRYALRKGVDELFTYGDLARAIGEGFDENAVHFDDKKELTEALRPYFETDCAVLIKGSRAFKMDEIVSALLEGK